MELNKIYNGDCLEIMQDIPTGSIDMILCDLPYGTTQNKWDSVIPFAPLWQQYERVIKDTGAIVLTAQNPFDKVLGCSNLSILKYEWIWEKDHGTGHLNAKKAPLKNHEVCLVYYKKPPTYNPQMTKGKPYKITNGAASKNYGSVIQVTTINNGDRYPRSVLKFARDKNGIHPTQKPVALFEYLIKTYTNEGETVLDNCIGSGTAAVACLRTGRNFIGIEKDPVYYEKACARIAELMDLL